MRHWNAEDQFFNWMKRISQNPAFWSDGWLNFSDDEDKKEYWRQWQMIKVDKKFGVIRPEKTECGICKKEIISFHTPDNSRRIYLDHDHKTGLFRGWLCSECNSRLGWYEKNIGSISSYLRRD